MVIYFKDNTWSQTTFVGKGLNPNLNPTSQYFSHSSCVTHILAEFDLEDVFLKLSIAQLA